MVSHHKNPTEDLPVVVPVSDAREVLDMQDLDACSDTCIPVDANNDHTNIKVNKHFREKMREAEYRKNFVHTMSICFAFLTLGVVGGQRGPSLLDLQIVTATDTQQLSLFITAMSAGYTCGSFPVGFLYDRISKPLMLFITSLTTGLLTGLLPFCSNYVVMLVVIFVGAMPMAGIDVGGNADIIRIWGKEGRSYMQAIHFCYAVGSVIGPLVTEPFLTLRQTEENPHPTQLSTNISSRLEIIDNYNSNTENRTNTLTIHSKLIGSSTHSPFQNSTTYLSFHNSTPLLSFQNATPHSSFQNSTKYSLYQNSTGYSSFQNSTVYTSFQNTTRYSSFQNSTTYSPFQNSTTHMKKRTTIVYIAYIIVAAACIIVSIPFLFLHCQQQPRVGENHEQGNVKNNQTRNAGLKTITVTLFIIIFLNIFYVAIEDTMANFMLLFVVRTMTWTKAEGTLITSTYWAAFAVSRFLGIFLIRCLSPTKCLFIVYSLLIVSCTGLLFSAAHSFHAGVWVSMTGAGLSMGVIFPTNYNLICEHITVTGKIASLISITASVGSIGNPAILGPLMQHYSPMWYVYLILGESVGCLVCFLVLLMYSGTCWKSVPATDSQTIVIGDVTCELIAKTSSTDQNAISESHA
ncbi:uncharacterized protein LOC121381186 [Gigantopelta aegis]|uniref:uncharacterized protein LOC121381186 n=1 Tax=Gigantopelta aegis TaxID=1735272 RepID=UPI001B88A733|nr:uncharacterized protein LOC121381186 [Gigantopelta aegis]